MKIVPKSISIIFISCLSSCSTIYMPTTKNPTCFTHKKDICLSGELSNHYSAANLVITPIENIYLHGEYATYSLDAYHNNHIYSYGLGAYKAIDSTNQLEIQASIGFANFDYGDPEDGSNYHLTLANGNSKVYSGFVSYSSIHRKSRHSFIINFGSVNVKYEDCSLSWLIGATHSAFNISMFYVDKFNLAKQLRFFFAPGLNFLVNAKDRIRYNTFSLRFGIELGLK